MRLRLLLLTAVLAVLAVLAGCQPGRPTAVPDTAVPGLSPTTGTPATTSTTAVSTSTATPTPPPSPSPTPPLWVIGARPLPLRADGFGQVLPTPPVLANRALPTPDLLAAPRAPEFTSSVTAVPQQVLRRSSWQASCPVRADQLRYLTMSFWGFDGRQHTGEMLVNARVATEVVSVFATLHAARFPLEEMRVVTAAELSAAPTGDGNNTTAFVCRPARGQTRWSAHAYGLAIDVNPFCNPYVRGDLVLPELASAYLDRAHARPGMLRAGDAVVRAFTAIGWTWGGTWSSPRDTMHFSATGN